MSDLEYDSSQEHPSWSEDEDDASNESVDSADNDDLGLSNAQFHEQEELAFEVLSPEEIITKQQQALARVQQVLPDLPVSNSRILLQHFKWDATKMLAEYTNNAKALRVKVGLPALEAGKGSRVEDLGLCLICLMDDEELVGVECGHKFCLACWRDYLHGEVKQKHTVILCPGKECTKVLDELTVIGYLDDEETKDRFRAALVQSFVDDNPMVRWCPAANCTNAIVLHDVLETKNEAVTCTCGTTFCFRCGVDVDHRPNSCRMFGEWRKKMQGGDTSLNDQLIATISRQCPKCQTSIQKNGGCNHMRCTLCAYHFCWQCMGKFGSGPKGGPDGYSTHRCNRQYEEDDNVSMKKEELQRFYWHSDRYGNHARSLAMELKLLNNSQEVISALSKQFGLSEEACKFYTKALKQLVANRHLLMQSYVFGYFRPMYAKNVNRDIFENLQSDLELHTEKLSHILEDTSPAAIQGSNHQAILHLTQVAKNVYQGLMDSANEWSSAGDVASPPSSPPVAPKTSKTVQEITTSRLATQRRKGSGFLKKLFKRSSSVDVADQELANVFGTNTNNNNNNNNAGGNY